MGSRPIGPHTVRILALAVGKTCTLPVGIGRNGWPLRTARKHEPERVFTVESVEGGTVVKRLA